MSYTLSLSFLAMADIESTVRWMETEYSSAKALAWYEGLAAAFADLAANPHQYARAEESGSFGYEIRQKLYGKRKRVHRILFTIDRDEINVIAVRHAARGELKP